jgi:hypothetical protein
MNSDFTNFIYARVEKALMENEEYKKIQSKCANAITNKDYEQYENLSPELEAKAQELSYMQGFNDAMQIIMNREG